jgi:hypothetical protein
MEAILMKYYYFAASLPSLSYDDKPYINSLEFQEECYRRLKRKDASYIKYCRYDSELAVKTVKPTGSDFIDRFMLRERVFVLNLANLRAAKLERSDSVDLPAEDIPRTIAVAHQAVEEAANPLLAEYLIDHERWDILDTMVVVGDTFSVDNIYIHLLKIQLLERKQTLGSKEKGIENYRMCYDAIIDEYNSGIGKTGVVKDGDEDKNGKDE